MIKAIYPGSFDPPTLGHFDIISRASHMFEDLTVLVMDNRQKNPLFSADNRVSMIRGVLDEMGLSAVNVDSDNGLMVDYCRDHGCTIVVRGLRSAYDFEYELPISHANKLQYDELETVFLTTSPRFSYLSSTIVREFASYGGDISGFVPEKLISLIRDKYK